MTHLPEIFGLWSIPLPSEIILLVLLAWILIAQGAKHGYHYSFNKGKQKASTPDWYPELHWTDRRMMWGLYALLICAGADVVRVLCAQSVVRPAFQWLIDMGATGKPWTEQDKWGEKDPGSDEWDTFQKGITRRDRLWLAGFNLIILIGYVPALRWIFDLVGAAGTFSFLT